MFDVNKFKLTPFAMWKIEQAEHERLARLTLTERFAVYDAEEANAMREVLAEEKWGST